MAATLMQGWLDEWVASGLLSPSWRGPVMPHLIWLAQTYQDDLGTSLQGAWDNFIQSGQVWALVIGFVVGYIFRSLTAY
jgi:hypothetical protein